MSDDSASPSDLQEPILSDGGNHPSKDVLLPDTRLIPTLFTVRRRWLLSVLGILILLALAVVSFTGSGGRVRPISGLATIGGLLGSIAGVAVYRPIKDSAETSDEIVATIRRSYVQEFSRSIIVIGYGTFVGYCYPRAMWNLGARVLGANGYPFGRIVWPLNGLPAAVLTTILLAGVTLVAIRLQSGSFPPLKSRRLLALAAGWTTYGLWIFVATGFAGYLWFPLLGVPV